MGLNIQIITLLVDDPNDGPPTMAGVQNWKDSFGLHEMGVYADPQYAMVVGNSVGTPQATVVNPRNMVVEHLGSGLGPLLAIAQANAATR
ncbi:MAG: hypothetical protein JRI68_07085 [Deltaproteobacteria bacterium]|nr:hypothetical protein [Deltaproteobacteria bacterium]